MPKDTPDNLVHVDFAKHEDATGYTLWTTRAPAVEAEVALGVTVCKETKQITLQFSEPVDSFCMEFAGSKNLVSVLAQALFKLEGE